MDNTKAICCVAGAVLINITMGTFYSFGNIMPYVASYMRNTGDPSVTAGHESWLTASFLLGQGVSFILGSWIEKFYNSRVAVVFGCIIHCSSTYMTVLAVKSSFAAVVIIYGFGSGFGSGSAYIASIIAAQKWFPSKKGFFTGVIVAGFGFGGLIFTNLQTIYINPTNLPTDSMKNYPKEVYDKVPNLFLYMAVIFTVAQTIGCLLAFPPQSSQQYDNTESARRSSGTQVNVTIDEGLPDIKTAFSPFKYKIFYIIGLMMVLVAPGVTFVNSMGKRFGQSYIEDDRFLTTVVALAAIANAGGRLTWGFLVDKLTFSTCFSIKCLLFATLIILFPFGFILSSKFLYIIWMLGLFFGFSGSFVLFPVFVEQVFGPKFGGIIYGILFIALALSSILTSYFIQKSVGNSLSDGSTSANEKFYVRLAPCAIIAISYCFSCALYFTVLPIRRIENAIKRRKETEIVGHP